MPHRTVPDIAVSAGSPASPYLMHALRDNDETVANSNVTYAAMLDNATGHVHGVGTRSYTYTYTDRIRVRTGVNDRVPFRFASSSPNYAAASYSATLDPGLYSLADLAAEIQAEMISEVGVGAPISVVYDTTEGSPTRGLFVFGHTGSSDSPNLRVLELLFGTGTGFATSIAVSIGFPKKDQKKAFAYPGDSGFADGFTQDVHAPTEGGLLGTDAWVAGAFTSAKIADDVISTRCFQNSSVSGSAGSDKIHDNTLDGDKTGAPSASATASISAGSTHTFSIAMPNNTSRTPMCVPFTNDAGGVTWNLLSVVSLTNTSGNNWDVVIKNHDTVGHTSCAVVAY